MIWNFNNLKRCREPLISSIKSWFEFFINHHMNRRILYWLLTLNLSQFLLYLGRVNNFVLGWVPRPMNRSCPTPRIPSAFSQESSIAFNSHPSPDERKWARFSTEWRTLLIWKMQRRAESGFRPEACILLSSCEYSWILVTWASSIFCIVCKASVNLNFIFLERSLYCLFDFA